MIHGTRLEELFGQDGTAIVQGMFSKELTQVDCHPIRELILGIYRDCITNKLFPDD